MLDMVLWPAVVEVVVVVVVEVLEDAGAGGWCGSTGRWWWFQFIIHRIHGSAYCHYDLL